MLQTLSPMGNRQLRLVASAHLLWYFHRRGIRVPDLPPEISELLIRWETGDKQALRVLFPLIYKELRQQAHRYFRSERPDHTLQPTALAHEVYLRLENQRPTHFQ